jgi:hypothetical protein
MIKYFVRISILATYFQNVSHLVMFGHITFSSPRLIALGFVLTFFRCKLKWASVVWNSQSFIINYWLF